MDNVDINNVEENVDWLSDYQWTVEFEGEIVSYNEELVSELMDMID